MEQAGDAHGARQRGGRGAAAAAGRARVMDGKDTRRCGVWGGVYRKHTCPFVWASLDACSLSKISIFACRPDLPPAVSATHQQISNEVGAWDEARDEMGYNGAHPSLLKRSLCAL